MPFTGKEKHQIGKDDAKQLIKNFHDNQKKIKIKSVFFGREFVLSLLNQSDCVGLRIYYAQQGPAKQDAPTMVIASEDSTWTVMTTVLGEDPPLCPPVCPLVDPLA